MIKYFEKFDMKLKKGKLGVYRIILVQCAFDILLEGDSILDTILNQNQTFSFAIKT